MVALEILRRKLNYHKSVKNSLNELQFCLYDQFSCVILQDTKKSNICGHLVMAKIVIFTILAILTSGQMAPNIWVLDIYQSTHENQSYRQKKSLFWPFLTKLQQFQFILSKSNATVMHILKNFFVCLKLTKRKKTETFM